MYLIGHSKSIKGYSEILHKSTGQNCLKQLMLVFIYEHL